MWRKALLAVAVGMGAIALPLLALPPSPQSAQHFPSSASSSISLVAVMPETASFAWSARSLPPAPSEPDLHAEVFLLQDRSVLARGRSSEVRCEWEGRPEDSSGLLPLTGFPESIPFQFSFLPRTPLKKLILPLAPRNFPGQENHTAAFVALYSFRDQPVSGAVRITVEAY